MLILILCSTAPGKDILIFRPTSGGELAVDVLIITQLLVPILERRESDGTAIFDVFGTGLERKFKAPNEIIMLCVNYSASIGRTPTLLKSETTTTTATKALSPKPGLILTVL